MASSSSHHRSTDDDVVPGDIINSGCWETSLKGRIYKFINCGGKSNMVDGVVFEDDSRYMSKTSIVTNEFELAGNERYSFLYQSGRMGDFKCVIHQIPEGFYFVDLHFSEQEAKKRIFHVFIQETMVLNKFDILNTVGDLYKPTSLVDTRVRVERDGLIKVQGTTCITKGEGPLIRGICIKTAASMQCPCCGTITETPLSIMRHELQHSLEDEYESKRKEVKREILRRRMKKLEDKFVECSISKEQQKEVEPEEHKFEGRLTRELGDSLGS